MKKNALADSIIKTLCYAQIFSYPLTVSEVWKYLIHDKKITREDFLLHLHQNKSFIEQTQGYIILPGDKKLIKERQKRAVYSRRKLGKALWISQILSYIPTVKLVAISGSLSMYNAKQEDDIDLFIVSSKNRLWTTRLLVNLVLLVLREKRGRKEKYAEDKICPNMFMSEDALEVKKHNLYTAHEVAQLKVIISKDAIAAKFFKKNSWVLRYLPHAFTVSPGRKKEKNANKFMFHLSLLELLVFKTQQYYMRNRITHEKIKKNLAAFHPRKQGEAILSLYQLKTKTYLHLLKKHKAVKQSPFRTIN